MITCNLVCYRTFHLNEPWTLESYLSIGGYTAWKRIVQEQIPPQVILEEIKQSALRGRGGAGFPTGMKWGFINRAIAGQKYVVCNSDEGEPGTCKDREILLKNPHQLIEGMAIAGYVIGATVGYNYIRGEFWLPFQRTEQAINTAYAAGLLGKNICNSSIDFDLYNHLGAGAYICGEETALLNSIEGKKGLPRFKPPFPAVQGLYGKPTLINNTETFASVPVIMTNGAQWFLNLGKPNNGGTKCFSISGHVNNPGNYEIPLGTSFRELLNLAGGMKDNKKIKAVIPGGSSMRVLPGEIMMNLDMDYDSIQQAGSGLGSGAVIVMNEATCMVNTLYRLAEFYMDESCGQCTPCREGTGWMVRLLHKIITGHGEATDLEQLIRVADHIEGRTICALGEAAAWPVQSFIKNFHHEFDYFIKYKKSMIAA